LYVLVPLLTSLHPFSDAGVSRSPTIVCAHLMKKLGWGVEQVIAHLKKIRRHVKWVA